MSLNENGYDNNSSDAAGVEAQRRRKAADFRLNIQDNYDDSGVDEDYSSEEINSYSGKEAKAKIERQSRSALKKKRRAEKRELKLKNKRNRRIFRWTWIISVLLVATMAGLFIVTGVNDLLAIGRGEPQTVTVKIPSKPTLNSVTDVLESSGVIEQPFYFKIFAQITKNADSFVAGTYELSTNMDYQAIITNLQGSSRRTDIVSVTIIEGQNVLEIADTLEKGKALGDRDKFLELCASDKFDDDFDFLKDIKNSKDRYYKLEGYLYPDKYDFYVNEDPESIIYKLLNNYEARLYEKQSYSGYDKLYNVKKMMEKTGTSYTLDEVMTIASIVQAEAADKEDMYYVSSILHNRLSADADMGVSALGLDSTKYYPYRNADALPVDEKNFKSKYDTYDNIGLPPGPICNPGMEAIKAALCPYESYYYYFCHDKDGTAYYASTIYEHEANLEIIS